MAECLSTMSYPLWSTSYQSWRKSNSAYYAVLPSALSTSMWFYPFDLISFYKEKGDTEEYKLQQLLECSILSDHFEMYKAIQEWLANKMLTREKVVIFDEVAGIKGLLPLR